MVGSHCPCERREKGLHTGVKKGCTPGKAARWLAGQITRAHGAQGDGSVRDCGTFRTQSTYRCRVMKAAVAMCCRCGYIQLGYCVGCIPKAKDAGDSVSAMPARRVSMSVHVAGCGRARPACRASCCAWGGHVSSRDPVFLWGQRAHTTHAAQVFVSNSP